MDRYEVLLQKATGLLRKDLESRFALGCLLAQMSKIKSSADVAKDLMWGRKAVEEWGITAEFWGSERMPFDTMRKNRKTGDTAGVPTAWSWYLQIATAPEPYRSKLKALGMKGGGAALRSGDVAALAKPSYGEPRKKAELPPVSEAFQKLNWHLSTDLHHLRKIQNLDGADLVLVEGALDMYRRVTEELDRLGAFDLAPRSQVVHIRETA